MSKRFLMFLTAGVLCLAASGPADAVPYLWDNVGGDFAWGNAANWGGGGFPDATTDTASFTGLGLGTVALGANRTVGALTFSNAAGTYTLSGNTLIVNDGLGSGWLVQNAAGANVIASQLSATNLAGSVSAGTLSLTNTTNAVTGTWTVSGGTLSVTTAAAASGLGSAGVTLSGGSLQLTASPTGLVNGLQERIHNDVPVNVQDNVEGLRAQPVGADDAQGTLTGHLTYPNDAAVSTRAAALGAVGFNNDNFSMLWVGDLRPNVAGQWGLRFNTEDDNASIWVDYNRNGVFELAAGERIYNRGCCGGSGDLLTASLTAGAVYRIGIAMSDTGGNGYFTDMEYRPPAGAWTDLNPGAAGGLFQTPENVVAVLANNVSVTANSAIGFGSGVYSARLGSLSMAANTGLTVSGQPLAFAGATSLGGGTATLDVQGTVLTLTGAVGETAASALMKTGSGTLVLSTGNTYTGLTTVSAGALQVGANNGLGTAAAGTVVNSGAALHITGGINYSTAEALTLNGTGIGNAGALRSLSGNNTLDQHADQIAVEGIRHALDILGGHLNPEQKDYKETKVDLIDAEALKRAAEPKAPEAK